MTRTEQALRLAYTAHSGQTRKTDNSPYIIHPIMVASMLTTAAASEEVIVAALLHDVLEDTDTDEALVLQVAGSEAMRIIRAVSEDKSLPWEERKAAYAEAVVAGGESVWLVSVADKIHNAESLLDHINTVGPDAWLAFNRGKETKLAFERLLYTKLADVWQHPLLDRYGQLITVLEAS